MRQSIRATLRAATISLFALFAGCQQGGEDYSDDYRQDPVEMAKEVDAWVQEDLQTTTCEPARNWLRQPGNMLFEGNLTVVQTLVDDLHDSGARQVWFTGIEELGNARLSASLAVELPGDSDSRAELLDIEAQFWQMEEPNPDAGQRYLLFTLD